MERHGAFLIDRRKYDVGSISLDGDRDHRITSVPWEPSLPVVTGWDLGIDDATAIWFAQIAGREISERQAMNWICIACSRG